MSPNPLLETQILEEKQKNFLGKTLQGNSEISGIFDNLVFKNCEIKKCNFEKSSFDNIEVVSCSWENSRFENSFFNRSAASHYSFENASFQNTKFKECDFSGGYFEKTDFSNASFEDSDFTLCEFKQVNFTGASFIRCNFNGSFFDDTKWNDNSFNDSTFLAVEGIDKGECKSLKEKGLVITLPWETRLTEILINRKLGWFFLVAFISLAWIQYPKIIEGSQKISLLDANPLHSIIEFVFPKIEKSFFDRYIHMPNYNFSSGLRNWSQINSTGTIKISRNEYNSFPASLQIKDFEGTLFYSPKSSGQSPIFQEQIWLDISSEKEMTFSFNYKLGHPRVQIHGKSQNNEITLIFEIPSCSSKEAPIWNNIATSFSLPQKTKSISLKLDQFPIGETYLDDVLLQSK